ncbi:conserved hypothetical protein [Hyphomicrobiales bacterium]|nr:conserved hypothetical protein [Hyphomicrobiales bacterium]CAH1687415.1 conserved hypothetical protein [Hyphomicrobiales bacterium]
MKLYENKKISFNTSHSSVETLQERLICKYHSLVGGNPQSTIVFVCFGTVLWEDATLIRAAAPPLLDAAALWFHAGLTDQWRAVSKAIPGSARPVMDVFVGRRTSEGLGVRLEGVLWLPSHWPLILEWFKTPPAPELWLQSRFGKWLGLTELAAHNINPTILHMTNAAPWASRKRASPRLYRSLEGDLIGGDPA